MLLALLVAVLLFRRRGGQAAKPGDESDDSGGLHVDENASSSRRISELAGSGHDRGPPLAAELAVDASYGQQGGSQVVELAGNGLIPTTELP